MTKYVESDNDFCRRHLGTRQGGEHGCDYAPACTACEGTGFANDDDPCEVCDGHGSEPCDLAPLLYEGRMGERRG